MYHIPVGSPEELADQPEDYVELIVETATEWFNKENSFRNPARRWRVNVRKIGTVRLYLKIASEIYLLPKTLKPEIRDEETFRKMYLDEIITNWELASDDYEQALQIYEQSFYLRNIMVGWNLPHSRAGVNAARQIYEKALMLKHDIE